MNEQSFSLHPFPSTAPLSPLKIMGNIARSSHTLALRYALLSDTAKIVIPPPADIPVRKNGLWEETCFEFFLALRDSPRYWEFNLSPAGHWNVYRFCAYRQGMQEEMALISLPFSVRNGSDDLLLDLEFDPGGIVRADQPLEIAISAVLGHKDGQVTYWALTHCAPQADFHRRDSFIIAL